MGGQDEHFGYLDVGRGIGSIYGDIGNIVTCQWLDAFIDISGTVAITMETDVTEVGLDKSGFQVRNTDGGMCNINAQTVGQCLHG